jgi:hypothetical protein
MYELTPNQKATLKKQGFVFIRRNGKKIRVTAMMVSNYMPSYQKRDSIRSGLPVYPVSTSAINRATDLALAGVGAVMAIQIGTSMLGLLPSNK